MRNCLSKYYGERVQLYGNYGFVSKGDKYKKEKTVLIRNIKFLNEPDETEGVVADHIYVKFEDIKEVLAEKYRKGDILCFEATVYGYQRRICKNNWDVGLKDAFLLIETDEGE